MELQVLTLAARRSMVLMTCTLLAGALVGLVAWAATPTVHRASAVLILDSGAVTSPGQEPFAGDPDRYISREMEALSSQTVLSRATGTIRPAATTTELGTSITLSHVTGSDVVRVTATSANGARASALADAVATAYLDLRTESAQEALQDQRSALQGQADALAERLSTEELAAPVANRLYATFDQLTTAISALDQPGVLHDDTRVINTSSEATATRGLGLPISVVGGTLLGALVGLAAAVARQLRRPQVAGQSEVEALTGQPVSAVFPHVRGLGQLTSVAALNRFRQPAARLAALTGTSEAVARPWVITCCSATAGAGCSTVASTLALRLAGEGQRVTVVTGGPQPTDAMAAPAPRSAAAPAPRAVGGPDRELQGPGTAVLDGGWQSAEGALPGVPLLLRRDTAHLTADDLAKALAEAAPGTDVVVVDASSVLDSGFAQAAVREGHRVVLVVPELDQPESDLRLALGVLTHLTDAPVHVALTRR